MKRLTITLIYFLLIQTLLAQSYSITEEIQIGSLDDEYLAEVIQLEDESQLLIGYTVMNGSKSLYLVNLNSDSSSINWEKLIPIELNLEPYNYTFQAIKTEDENLLIGISSLVLKIDTVGNIIWQTSLSNSISDIESIIENASGYLFLGFGSSSQLIQTDSEGNVLWTKQYGASINETFLSSIIETENGNLMLAGYHVLNQESFVWITITDSLGNIIKEGAPIDTYNPRIGVTSLIKTSDNNYLLSSIVSGESDSLSFTNKHISLVTKIDSDGNLIWHQTYKTNLNNNYIIKTYELEDNSLILLGTAGTHGTDPNALFWIIKTDKDGNELHQQILDSNSQYSTVAALSFNQNCDITLFGSSHMSALPPSHFDFTILCLDNNTATTEEPISSALNLYPNPAYDELFISNKEMHNSSFNITNVYGEVIAQRKLDHNRLSLTGIESGIYFISKADSPINIRNKIIITR